MREAGDSVLGDPSQRQGTRTVTWREVMLQRRKVLGQQVLLSPAVRRYKKPWDKGSSPTISKCTGVNAVLGVGIYSTRAFT